jgi:hypothetical protein
VAVVAIDLLHQQDPGGRTDRPTAPPVDSRSERRRAAGEVGAAARPARRRDRRGGETGAAARPARRAG